MSSKHDPNQVGLPAGPTLHSKPTLARQDELASWDKRATEAQAICDAHNRNPDAIGVMSHGWAWKGYGFRLDLPLSPHATLPTPEEILATEVKSGAAETPK